jgi:hypothetical protein
MDLAAARMTTQGLVTPIGAPAEVVRRLVALQAQDNWVAPYAIRPRSLSGVDTSAGLIRTWLMRGTLHLVAREDAGWLVSLLGPRFLAKHRARRHQLGLTDEMLKQALPVVAGAVPGTRDELVAAVRKRGIDLPGGQAEAYLAAAAAMSGLIYKTANGFAAMPRGGKTFENPLQELAIRYLAGHAPASPEDFAAWTGLPLTECRKAMAGLPEAEEQPVPTAAKLPPRMLGHLDPFLLGYKDRGFTLDPKHAKQVQRGGGFLQPVILVRGKVAGIWSRERKAGQWEITVTSFGGKLPSLDAEIESLRQLS